MESENRSEKENFTNQENMSDMDSESDEACENEEERRVSIIQSEVYGFIYWTTTYVIFCRSLKETNSINPGMDLYSRGNPQINWHNLYCK